MFSLHGWLKDQRPSRTSSAETLANLPLLNYLFATVGNQTDWLNNAVDVDIQGQFVGTVRNEMAMDGKEGLY